MPPRSGGLLIHHWDTDGVCSAALLLRHRYRGYTNWTPTLGAFYLSPDQIRWIQQFDEVVIADMALPRENVDELARMCDVTVYDHHHQEPIEGVRHINPVARGSDQDEYPSCTWVLKEHLSLPTSLHVVLGLVGDREDKLKETPVFWELTQRFAAENGLAPEALPEMVQLIDSCYKMGDREAVTAAPRLLAEKDDAATILRHRGWKRNRDMFDEELRKILETQPVERGGVLYLELDTKLSVISTVTRKIAWGTGRDTVVVNRGFFDEDDQLYCRSGSRDMQPIIDRARSLGYNAGGKKDVLGAIVPKGETDSFVDELMVFLKK